MMLGLPVPDTATVAMEWTPEWRHLISQARGCPYYRPRVGLSTDDSTDCKHQAATRRIRAQETECPHRHCLIHLRLGYEQGDATVVKGLP